MYIFFLMESYQKNTFILQNAFEVFCFVFFKVVKIIKVEKSACYLIMPLFDKQKTLAKKKSCIQEILTLSACADSSTNTLLTDPV